MKVLKTDYVSWSGYDTIDIFARGDKVSIDDMDPDKPYLAALSVKDDPSFNKIYCTAISSPAPDVRLFHEGRLIEDSHPRLTIAQYEPDVTRLIYTIDVDNLSSELGQYTCQAKIDESGVVKEEAIQAIVPLHAHVYSIHIGFCDYFEAHCNISGNPLPIEHNFNVFCNNSDVPIESAKKVKFENDNMLVELRTIGPIFGPFCNFVCNPDNDYGTYTDTAKLHHNC